MQQRCPVCVSAFEISASDLAFCERISPVIGGRTFTVPPPTHCPDCRLQRRVAWRNERRFYHRNCDACHEPIISIYHSSTPFPVYCYDCWWGEGWDATGYGRDVDATEPFFDQFARLKDAVPRLYFVSKNCENSEYCNQADSLKNCYLAIGSSNSEQCLYGKRFQDCRDCVDCLFVDQCELCYECVSCLSCYNVCFGINCKNVQDARLVIDCQSSSDLLFCKAIRGGKYRILNEEHSEAVFKKERDRILASPATMEEYRKRFEQLTLSIPVRHAITHLAENCTGNYITESENAHQVFSVRKVRDVRYVQDAWMLTDSSDVFSFYGPGELCYEVIAGAFGFHHCLFTSNCWPGNELLYCDHCFNCKQCFGCVGLSHKKYCILNKQYTKEEYEVLVPKIVEHMKQTPYPESSPAMKSGSETPCTSWGEFFPVSLSPFAYNETLAQEYFPLSKEEVLKRGWRWKEQKDEVPEVEKIIPAHLLPDVIDEIPDDVLNWAIECEATKRPFRIIKQELAFYRKQKLPLPHFHPDERHRRRMALRNPRKLWSRTCGKCGKEIQTTYAPDRLETVYCEECYLKAVY